MNNFKSILRGLKTAYKISPATFRWTFILGIVQTLAPYFSLSMSALIVNELIYSRDVSQLIKYTIMTIGGAFTINVFKEFIKNKANARINNFWREMYGFFLSHQSRLEYRHLENSDVSLLFQRIKANGNATGAGLWHYVYNFSFFISAVSDIILSAALTISMFTIKADAEFTGFFGFINSYASILVIIGIILFDAISHFLVGKKRTEKIQKAWEPLARLNTTFMAYSNVNSNDDVPIFNMRTIILKELEKLTKRPQYLKDTEKISLKYGILNTIISDLTTIILFIFVAAKVYIGVFGIGNFMIYRRSVSKFVDGISSLSRIIGMLIHNNRYLKDIFEFLDLPDDMYKGNLSVEKRSDNRFDIEFKNVSFKYPGSNEYTLKDINIKFTVGSKSAVVGMNGSGKTTFIKLLCRLYDPTEGEILLNGIDIKKYKYDEYMRIFSVVFQDFTTFSFSVAENVAAALDYDADRVKECLVKAGLGERLESLPFGIESCIEKTYDKNGTDFSGGEKQKLALARALYKGAPFIILDEPTASLDPIAEADIYSRFDEIVDWQTTLYISHRLSSCRFCQNIIVFDNGTIVQQGSHQELIADTNGKYYELWNAQAQYYN